MEKARNRAPVPFKVDSKGRVSLGRSFANALVLVRKVDDDVVEVVRAEAVPAKEAWLHKNKKALESVMRGLEQTGTGDFADSPDLDADEELAKSVKG